MPSINQQTGEHRIDCRTSFSSGFAKSCGRFSHCAKCAPVCIVLSQSYCRDAIALGVAHAVCVRSRRRSSARRSAVSAPIHCERRKRNELCAAFFAAIPNHLDCLPCDSLPKCAKRSIQREEDVEKLFIYSLELLQFVIASIKRRTRCTAFDLQRQQFGRLRRRSGSAVRSGLALLARSLAH